MTKKEMVSEMLEGLSYCSERVITDRCVNASKKFIEAVYDFYVNCTNKDIEAKMYCDRCLVSFNNLKRG